MKAIIAIVALVATMAAHAQTRIISIDAFDFSYTGGLKFEKNKGASGVSNRKVTEFRFNLNYAQELPEYKGFMWKGKFHFNRDDNDGDVMSAFGLAGGALYNFQDNDIKNSIFAGAMLGLERATVELNNDDESGFNIKLFLEAGKRWDLGQYAKINVSYAPSVSLELTRYGGGIRKHLYKSASDFRLNFLKFDILF